MQVTLGPSGRPSLLDPKPQGRLAQDMGSLVGRILAPWETCRFADVCSDQADPLQLKLSSRVHGAYV